MDVFDPMFAKFVMGAAWFGMPFAVFCWGLLFHKKRTRTARVIIPVVAYALTIAYCVAPWMGFGSFDDWITLALVGSFFLVVPALSIFIAWQFERQDHKGHCTECSYNLTGNTSGACPECGTMVEESQAD